MSTASPRVWNPSTVSICEIGGPHARSARAKTVPLIVRSRYFFQPITIDRSRLDLGESRLRQQRPHLCRGSLITRSARQQSEPLKHSQKLARLVVVKQKLLHQHRRSCRECFVAVPENLQTVLVVPIVDDVRHEDGIHIVRIGTGEEVAAEETHAVGANRAVLA